MEKKPKDRKRAPITIRDLKVKKEVKGGTTIMKTSGETQGTIAQNLKAS